jgi:acyl-coenzyme A synthetase/AMP-(fatty) acid ligase
MVSHQNASSFVRWGSDTFRPGASDVFSAHAPFHFDLSVWDIFAAVRHGARLVVVPDYIGKEPRALAELIARERITMWYSAPSTLSLLAQFGAIHKHDFSSLRMVLFAGEVFPVVHLRSLVRQLPHPRYFNLYGPTETNVCTWFETPRVVPEDRVEPYPIGRTCAHLKSRVVDGDGGPVPAGVEGELCISGTSVMLGYWGRPEMTNDAFLPAEGDLERWYRTGDIVAEDAEGNYRFIGRRDRMIKKRGYRIELGEIESCLYGHPDVRHVAVVALSSDRSETVVKAHIMPGGERRPSLMELKTFCSERLPVYMVPDAVAYHDDLPMTSTGKMDYVALTRLA